MPRIPKNKSGSTHTQFDPEIHHKTKGGHGFGMKKNIKAKKYESSGLHLVDIFKWEVPKHLRKAYEEMKKENA